MRSLGFGVVVIAALMAWGCGGDEEGPELPDVDCEMGEIPTYDEVDAFDTCTVCHSSDLMGSARNEAPEEYNFDTYAGAMHEPEEVAHEVFEGAMPPPDSGLMLSEAEKQELYKWALCGTPQ